MNSHFIIAIPLLLIFTYSVYIWAYRKACAQLVFQTISRSGQPAPRMLSSVGRIIPSDLRQERINSISQYYNAAITEEEIRLMEEIDRITTEQELKGWFELLKTGHQHKNIPKRVYLRVSTLLNGYVWFDEEEYAQRVKTGKPVHKVTHREYALEKQLDDLKSVQQQKNSGF